MKRSLIMLLVVALLSTLLVPAMAEDVAKKDLALTFEYDILEKELDGTTVYWYQFNNFKVANTEAGASYYIKWTSSDKNVVLVPTETEFTAYDEEYNGSVSVGYIAPGGPVTITGHLYSSYNEDLKVEKSFKATAKEIPADKVEINAPAKIVLNYDDTTNLYAIVTANQEKYPGLLPTYRDVNWKVEPENKARITMDGSLTVNKEAAAGDKIKVTATTKGASPVSKTVEITITPEGETPEDRERIYFKSIDFSSKEYTINVNEELNLGFYSSPDPLYTEDELIWTVDDEKVVEIISQGKGYIPVGDRDVYKPYAVIKGIKEGTTAIHVKSKYNKDFKEATITVNVRKKIPFEKLEFSGVTEITLELDESEELRDYLTAKPENCNDSRIWSSDNPQVARVDRNTGRVEAVSVGDAKISVLSRLNPEVKTATPLTVHVVEKDTDNLFTKLSFTEKSLPMIIGEDNLDLDPYLVKEPADATGDRVVYTASDPTIVAIYGSEVEAKREGTVTITARSLKNPKAEVGTIEIKVSKAEEKTIETLTFITKELKLNPTDFDVDLRQYLQITPKDSVYDYDLVWTSDNPQFVTVFGGVVSFTESTPKPGSATITVYAESNPKATDSIKVTLVEDKVELKNLTFTKDIPTEMTLGKGEVYIADYIITDPTDFDRSDLVFESSDPQVAFVGPDGYLYAGRVGSVTITVYAKGSDKKYTFPITVKTIPVTAVNFNKDAKYEIKVGDNIELFTTNYMSFAPESVDLFDDNVELTWTSSDEEIATVRFGTVTGKKPGNATITVLVRNADGSTAEGKVDVTVKDAANKLTGIAFKKDEYKLEVGTDTDYEVNEHRIAVSKMFKFTPADIDVTAYDWTKFDFYSSNDDVVRFERVGGVDDGSDYVPCFVFRTFKPGTVTITAQSRENAELKAETKLTVEPIKVKKIARPTKFKSIDMPLYDVEFGSEEDYSRVNFKWVYVNVTPAYAYYETKWETSDASVAYVVKEEGDEALIKAVAPGTCKIKVTVTDGTNTFTRDMFVTVKAAKVTKLALNRSKVNAYIIKGAENTFQLTATDAKTGYEVPVKWTSSDAKVAKVYQSGKVKFLTAGTAEITATTKDGNKVSKTCTFTVKKLAVTEVKPASKSVTIKVGGEKTLKAKVKPAKAFNTALYFKSSDTKVVAVDQDGVVLGLKPGKATITITARDGSKKSATITVYVKAVTAANDGELEVLDGDLAIEGELLEDSFDIDVAGEEIVIADDEAVELSVD